MDGMGLVKISGLALINLITTQVGKTRAYHPIADAWPVRCGCDRLCVVKDVFFNVYIMGI